MNNEIATTTPFGNATLRVDSPTSVHIQFDAEACKVNGVKFYGSARVSKMLGNNEDAGGTWRFIFTQSYVRRSVEVKGSRNLPNNALSKVRDWCEENASRFVNGTTIKAAKLAEAQSVIARQTAEIAELENKLAAAKAAKSAAENLVAALS